MIFFATFVTSKVTIMNARLKQFIAAENITQAQFADSINVVRASVSHILAGRNKPGYEFISGLMRRYPNLNMEWLMFGKGKMYKDSAAQDVIPEINTDQEPIHSQDSLFSDFTEPDFAHVNEIPVQSTVTAPSESSLNEIKTLIAASQQPVNQRKLIKITAFFDDGTFQELTSN